MQTADVLPKATSATAGPVADEEWSEIIQPHSSLFDLRLGDIWHYRDLVMMFVRRDFVSNYKQTILGPLWFFIQPVLSTVMYVIIFGRVVKLAPSGTPETLFYLSGVTVWGYFSQTLTNIATVFTANAAIFGKVYFPRLTMPISIVISNIVRFGIQYALFLAVWVYYLLTNSSIHPNWLIALTPLLLVMMGLLSLGLGMIFSALTTKYRDLTQLLAFGVQLAMYATTVVYPLSKVSPENQWKLLANPMTAILETFRYSYLGVGTFSWGALAYSLVFTLLVLFAGTVIFNKVEKSFTDTV